MKRILVLAALLASMLSLAISETANAQARTWVSSIGNDANPCSRLEPCRTFAVAISKTEAGGKIDVIDSGDFGAVTIAKSITISSEGADASVLASGVDGIVISAGINDVVFLRGLDIDGLGTGLSGIKVLSAGVVRIENCTINNFTQTGIEFVPSAAYVSTSQLHVSNSIIRNNNGASSGGILIRPGTNVLALGMIEDTLLTNNGFGLRVEDNSQVIAKNTTAVDNISGSGFIATSNMTGVTLILDKCVADGNSFGIRADGPNAAVLMTHCMIAGNGTGISSGASGAVSFTGTNFNADSGTATGPNIAPQ